MLSAVQERGSYLMSGDILNKIDDVVEAAREHCCACGCGRRLTADGPSLYYAEQSCQQKHTSELSAGLLIDPPEQAPGFTGLSGRTGFSELREEIRREHRRIGGVQDERRAHYLSLFNLDLVLSASASIHEPPCAPRSFAESGAPSRAAVQAATVPLGRHRHSPEGYRAALQFVRACQGCGTTGPVINKIDALAPVRHHSDQVVQSCVLCRYRYDRAVLGVWGYSQGMVVMTAEHGPVYTMATMSVNRFDRCADPTAMARRSWADLTARVLAGQGITLTGDSGREIGFNYLAWLHRMAEIIT